MFFRLRLGICSFLSQTYTQHYNNGQEVYELEPVPLSIILLVIALIAIITVVCIVVMVRMAKNPDPPCDKRGRAEVIGYTRKSDSSTAHNLCVKILDIDDDTKYSCQVNYPIEATSFKKGDIVEVMYSDKFERVGITFRGVEIAKETVSEEHYNEKYLQRQTKNAKAGKKGK